MTSFIMSPPVYRGDILFLSWMSVCPSVPNRVRSISPRRLEGFSWNLCQMFTSSRRCAEPMSRPYRFKVKVTLEGQRFEPLFRVRSISPRRLEGFSWNLCQMFTSSRRCAEPMSRPYRFKVKVSLKVKGLSLYFVSAPYLQDGLKDFHETCVRCSPHQGDVQNPCLDHTGSRSRSHLKVKGLSLDFVSAPYLQDGLKDFHETWVRCSPHQGDVQNPCLDHTGSRSRSRLKVKGLSLDFVSAPYLQDGLKDFHETWSDVHLI